jgi:hypothetical protein
LDVVPIRGNVDTRLAKVTAGEVDAVVLARAGLARLDRLAAATEVLDPLQMLPAPAQGALAVECRDGDTAVEQPLAALEDLTARAAVTAERALLAALEAGCTAPVGAYAEVAEGEEHTELYLRAVVASPDGSATVRLSATGPSARRRDARRRGRRTDGRTDLVSTAQEDKNETARPPRPAAARRRARPVVMGSVAFVGTGPGDPTLLTLRAVEALRGADVVVLDRAMRDTVLSHCHDQVEVLDGAFDGDGGPRTHARR